MPHQPSVVRQRRASIAVAGLLGAAALAPSATAQTVIPGTEAPLIVQGNACVGAACETSNPGLPLQLRNGNTPGIRLDQSNTGGFLAQTWDVAGNEANFFVRDLTAESALPFRIAPGAPTNNLTLRGGSVGVGTWSPQATLDVTRNGGNTALRVAETSTTVAERNLATLQNNGPVSLRLSDTNAGAGWQLATGTDGTVALIPTGPGALPGLVLSSSGAVTARSSVAAGGSVTAGGSMTATGNVNAGGTVQQTADPARQSGIETVEPSSLLDEIRTIPIERFDLDADGGAAHLAPNGAAFHAAFGLGAGENRIAPGDVGAVALAGVQALLDGDAGTDPRVAPLSARVDGIETRIAGIDERVDGLDGDGASATLRGLAERADGQDARIGSAEQVQHGHERRIRELERQATLAGDRFQRSNRAQRRLRSEVSTLREENVRLERRLSSIEAALARRR